MLKRSKTYLNLSFHQLFFPTGWSQGGRGRQEIGQEAGEPGDGSADGVLKVLKILGSYGIGLFYCFFCFKKGNQYLFYKRPCLTSRLCVGLKLLLDIFLRFHLLFFGGGFHSVGEI